MSGEREKKFLPRRSEFDALFDAMMKARATLENFVRTVKMLPDGIKPNVAALLLRDAEAALALFQYRDEQ